MVTAPLVPTCPEPENSQRSSGHFPSLSTVRRGAVHTVIWELFGAEVSLGLETPSPVGANFSAATL